MAETLLNDRHAEQAPASRPAPGASPRPPASRHAAESGPDAKGSRGALRWSLGLVLALAVLTTGMSWVLASPLGGSPDDDFHLGSIWCPRPVESSGCATREHNGEIQVLVPERVSDTAGCLAFHEEIAANCQGELSDEEKTYSRRYDDGNYPIGYYRFHHLLVGADVDESALAMRAANVLIAVGLLGGIGWLLPGRYRERYALAIILAWMPMGIYLVASNNPSSWALTGVLGYAAGMLGSLGSQEWRRWALLGLALLGALLSCASRGDSAFYLLVVSLAVFIGIRWRGGMLAHAAIAAVVSAIGAWMMLSSGQSQAVASAEASSALSDATRLRLIILTVPEYFGGFFGSERWGAGWFDVPWDGPIAVLALGLAGIALFSGARTVGWRKLLSAGVLAGALVCLPIVLSYTQGFESTYDLQPRYLLPLLAPFFLLWLGQARGEAVLTGAQAVLVVGLSSLAHAYALHRILLRYTHGLISHGKDDAGWLPTNLSFQPKWWWDIPLGPMAVWALGSLMYAVAIAIAVLLARMPGGPQEEALDQSEAPGSPGGAPDRPASLGQGRDGGARGAARPGTAPGSASGSAAQAAGPDSGPATATDPGAAIGTAAEADAGVVPEAVADAPGSAAQAADPDSGPATATDPDAATDPGAAGGPSGLAGAESLAARALGEAGRVAAGPEELGPWENMPDAEPQRSLDAVPASPVSTTSDPASSAASAALAAG